MNVAISRKNLRVSEQISILTVKWQETEWTKILVSIQCMHFKFKICQIVDRHKWNASISRIFLNLLFGGFFPIEPAVLCSGRAGVVCLLASHQVAKDRGKSVCRRLCAAGLYCTVWPILLCYTDCYSIVANSAHRLRILLTKELNSLPSSTTTSVSNTSSPVSKQRKRLHTAFTYSEL